MYSSINLTLYTQDDCGYCHLLKKKLAEWDFRYREINVSYDLFAKGVKDQKIKDKLKDLTNEAFKLDVFGAPTFLVNNKLFWGQDRLEYAIDESEN